MCSMAASSVLERIACSLKWARLMQPAPNFHLALGRLAALKHNLPNNLYLILF